MQNEMIADRQTPKTKRASSWVVSLVIHSVAIAALLSYHSVDTLASPSEKELVTPLVYVPPVEPLYTPVEKIRAPRPVVQTPAPTPVQHALVVKAMPAIIPQMQEKPTIVVPEMVPSNLPALAVARLQTPDLPSRPPAPAIPVKTGVFENPGQSPNGHTPSPRLEVQTGGFGSAQGGRPELAVNGNGTGVHTGAFGDTERQGTGMPSGNGKSVLVANAGFGTASAGPAAPVQRQAQSSPSETPVEVLWKPKPAYTEEAREKKLEGDVTLEVMFRASGDVQVLRVVHGLGAGLDESARAAAQQIRFRPGKKDGVPVDRTGVVLIKFELS
jgi:TonB family protein